MFALLTGILVVPADCIDEVDLLEDTDTVPRKTSWWSYFTPYYYFYSS